MKQFFFRYAATILLVAVAVVQIVRAHTMDQSPWKGGGFGMFATVDGWTRFIRIVDDEGAYAAPVSTITRSEQALVVPDEATLETLGQHFVEAGVEPPFTLEAWKVRFDADTLEVTPEKMTTVEVAP